jgi:hypothetical protein
MSLLDRGVEGGVEEAVPNIAPLLLAAGKSIRVLSFSPHKIAINFIHTVTP